MLCVFFGKVNLMEKESGFEGVAFLLFIGRKKGCAASSKKKQRQILKKIF